MKIRQKLILSYLTISLFGAIAGLLGIQNIHRVQLGFDLIADQTIPVKNELNNLQQSVDDLINCSLTIILLNKNREKELENNFNSDAAKSIEIELHEEIKETEQDKENYQEALKRYKFLINSYFSDEKKYFESISKTSQEIFKISEELIQLEQENDLENGIFMKERELNRARDDFKEAIQKAQEHERFELKERQADLHSTLKTSVQIIFNVSLLNVLLAIFIGFLVSVSISNPIEELKNVAVAIGKGKLERRIEVSAKDELGLLAQTFNRMAEDLHQYISALQEAKEEKALLATALENVTDAIEITDKEAKYLYVNPAFEVITGFSKQEVLGKSPALLRSGKHSHEFYEEMFKTVTQKRVWHGVLVSKRKDGTLYDQELTLSPIVDAAGELTHIVAVKRDVTERQAIERMKDEFVSVVSHELRTPLAAIQGGLSLLASGLMSAQSERGQRVIEIAAESVDHLVLLVNDILEVERLALGKVPLEKRLCQAESLVFKAQEQVQPIACRAGVELCVMSESITFVADPDRMNQVLTNLLGNAIKFSPRGSTIWFSVAFQSEEDHLLFTIRDQGRGIPAEHLETIFERFQQVDASDSRKKGGTGLGLAICRSIVQQHGGRIWVESLLGKGSSFYVAIPKQTTEDNYYEG